MIETEKEDILVIIYVCTKMNLWDVLTTLQFLLWKVSQQCFGTCGLYIHSEDVVMIAELQFCRKQGGRTTRRCKLLSIPDRDRATLRKRALRRSTYFRIVIQMPLNPKRKLKVTICEFP